MNSNRRKELDRAARLLAEAQDKVTEARDVVRQCAEEEQEYYDNMPESLQSGDKGSTAEQAASTLSELADELDTACETIEGAGDKIAEAQGG